MPSRSRDRRGLLGGLVLGVLSLSGCSSEQVHTVERFGLPQGITNQTDRITTIWQGAWIAALLVGILVWGLILWSAVAFRRRRGDTGLPAQVRYNVPVEALYTALPLILVVVFFFFTARDESAIANVSGDAQHKITVVGKRWSWDFNYDEPTKVFDTGTPDAWPTLYLPLGESVEFQVEARDVAHSFWVPAFQYKLDAIPGRINRFQVTPTREGTFPGLCAELCGVDHSKMRFMVKVVPPAQYQQHLQDLVKAGQTGDLSVDLGPKADLQPPGSSSSGEKGSDR